MYTPYKILVDSNFSGKYELKNEKFVKSILFLTIKYCLVSLFHPAEESDEMDGVCILPLQVRDLLLYG